MLLLESGVNLEEENSYLSELKVDILSDVSTASYRVFFADWRCHDHHVNGLVMWQETILSEQGP